MEEPLTSRRKAEADLDRGNNPEVPVMAIIKK
jgi:hypothetical protein